MNNIIPLLRLGVFGAVLLFALIVLGTDAYVVSEFNKSITVFGETLKSSVPASNSLGVAVSVITFATLGPLLGISLARQGAAISMVVVELSVVFVLWVLWLTVGGYTASQWSGCDSLGLESAVSTPCGCSRAAAAFGFLSFFALLAYFLALLVFSILAMNRGNPNIWTTPVTEADFSEKPVQHHLAPPGGAYPPQQPQYPPNVQYTGQVPGNPV